MSELCDCSWGFLLWLHHASAFSFSWHEAPREGLISWVSGLNNPLAKGRVPSLSRVSLFCQGLCNTVHGAPLMAAQVGDHRAMGQSGPSSFLSTHHALGLSTQNPQMQPGECLSTAIFLGSQGGFGEKMGIGKRGCNLSPRRGARKGDPVRWRD